jgi:SAM-dependent methyltransferase
VPPMGRLTRKITRRHLDDLLSEYASNERVLDVGSGGSSYDRFFPNRVTVDIDPGRKPQIVADAHDLPFADGEFSLVLCTEMLEHVADPTTVAAELMRVLEQGGHLILTTRFVYPLHEVPHDYWRFTKYGLEKLFTQWRVVEIRAETRPFSGVGALLQRLCYQEDLRGGKVTKAALLLLAQVLDHLNWLIVREYGDISRTTVETDILSTGLFLLVEK